VLQRQAPFPRALSPVNLDQHKVAKHRIAQWPGYQPTPLISLPELAAECGLAEIHAKDEGARFDLGSFKPLGAPLAICEILREIAAASTGHHVSTEEMLSGKYRRETEAVSVATASDGNHGVAVAWGARLLGCRSIVYMHSGSSEIRAQMVRDLGGVVMRCEGDYPESVRRCAKDATQSGWPLVQDWSWDGYESVPRLIYQGYTVLAAEIIEQLEAHSTPTHVLINAGVGGLASAVCGHLWEHYGEQRPVFLTVEPSKADCVLRSGRAGKLSKVPGDLDTIQNGLGCAEVTPIAWNILKLGTDHFISVEDQVVGPTMKLLAECSPPIVAGESAVAGLAVLLAAAKQPDLKANLGLDEHSRVVVVVCEGATDPVIYEKCVGKSVHAVNSSKFYTKLCAEASGRPRPSKL